MLSFDKTPIIKLNVGGTRFHTDYNTIESSVYLKRMLLRRAVKGLDEVFIDRSGSLFKHVLFYLQERKIASNLTHSELLELQEESVFYGLEGLWDMLYDKLYDSWKNSAKISKDYVLVDIMDLQSISCVSENTPNGDVYLTDIIQEKYEVISVVKYHGVKRGNIQSKLLLAKIP